MNDPLDRSSLAALRPRMEAVAVRYSRDPEAARDIVQLAFEKALRHAESFRGEARLSTWLHTIVCNEARMWLRGERRRLARITPVAAVEELSVRDEGASPDIVYGQKRELEKLAKAVNSLCAVDREVLVECALGGKSYERYASERGLSSGAAKSRAFRARARLLRELREDIANSRIA